MELDSLSVLCIYVILVNNKIVENAKHILENESISVVYGELIDDSDNEELKQCLLFIISRSN